MQFWNVVLIILLVIISLFILYALMIIISSLLVDPRKIYKKSSRFYRWIMNNIACLILFFSGTHVKMKGIENIPDGKYLFVCNHRSKFDPIIAWYKLKKSKLAFLSKKENFNIPFYGRIIKRCCFMEISRDDAKEALETVNTAADLITRDEVSIGVYPEGTRNTSDGILPFHNGVFLIAKKAGVPIVVSTMRGTDMIRKNFPLKKSFVEFDIAEVLDKEYVVSHSTAEIGSHIRDIFIKKTSNAK